MLHFASQVDSGDSSAKMLFCHVRHCMNSKDARGTSNFSRQVSFRVVARHMLFAKRLSNACLSEVSSEKLPKAHDYICTHLTVVCAMIIVVISEHASTC